MKTLLFLIAVFLSTSFLYSQSGRTPAFPTAEGYGKWTTGGRGGKVVKVTNLEDDGVGNIEGSFRWALKQYSGEPITVVFSISGTIDLNGKDLRSKRNDVTIAGQTAPGDGICIKGGNVNLGGSRNVIIRHIRSRVGLTNDNGFIAGACLSIENGGQFIVDHCSFSWSAEENIGFYDNDSTTVQWCLIAEGLYDAGHGKGARSYGAVVGGKTATYHHNLIAHNVSRSPRFGATTKNDPIMLLDYINNVHYNWGAARPFYGGDNRQGTNGKFQVNIINNYYKPGPARNGSNYTPLVRASFYTQTPVQGRNESLWHLSGNYIEGNANAKINNDNYAGVNIDEYTTTFPDITIDDLKRDYFNVPYPIQVQTAQDAYNSVLTDVGAFPRDTIDRRIINETVTGTAAAFSSYNAYRITGIVDKPADSGGFAEYESCNFVLDTDNDGIPDYWEKANGLDFTNLEDRNKLSPEGYTYLEVYLNGLVGEQLNGFNYPDPEYITSVKEEHSSGNFSLYFDKQSNTVKIGGTDIISAVQIYNLCGNKAEDLLKEGISEVNVEPLTNGVYIVVCKSKSGDIYTRKFIK